MLKSLDNFGIAERESISPPLEKATRSLDTINK